MIHTAKIIKLVDSIGKYEIAVNNFYLNYRQYPGDATQFTPPGDGDGRLSYSSGCAASPNDALSTEEYSQVWAHLSQAGMVDKNYVPYSPTSDCTGGVHPSYSSSNLNDVVWPGIETNSSIPSYGRYTPMQPVRYANQNFGFF